MARGPFLVVALVAAVAVAFAVWTEPRVELLGADTRGRFQGELVNVGRTRVVAVVCDGPPRHPATCGCARLAEVRLAPGERRAVRGAAVRKPVACGLRP